MAFDVDAFREAHRPWSFTHQGRTFVARHVSSMKVLDYEDAARRSDTFRAKDPTRAARQHLRALHVLLRNAFPWRLTYKLRGDPVTTILQLEPAARAAALQDFFACLQGMTADPLTRQPTPKTPGTRSRERTPHRSP